ncbi:hypothetical protein LINGRAHAP2_LOCUS36863, partial [Linum grandiflorum]
MYISPSVRPLLSTWFDPEPDDFGTSEGQSGFQERAVCGQDHWMDDIDLLGIATLFNWSIVVYAWGYGKAYGRSYLPLSVGPGVERPTSIVSLVNNGTHLVLVQLCDVHGVYALPEFHGMWTGIHNHHEGKVETWEA